MKTVEDQLKEIRTAGGTSFRETQARRSRVIAVVLVGATMVSLLFLAFAFHQRSNNETLQSELNAVRAELEACRNGK